MLALSGGKLGEKKSAQGLIEPGIGAKAGETPPASFAAARLGQDPASRCRTCGPASTSSPGSKALAPIGNRKKGCSVSSTKTSRRRRVRTASQPTGPISVAFIPTSVFDNPALRVNPEYLARLLSLALLKRERLLGAIGRSGRRPLYLKREWCAMVDEVRRISTSSTTGISP